MGKILKILASTKLPKNTIFSDRFVAECCETFHFHFRNLRFEVTRDDFLQLRQALREIEENYVRHGEPKSHHHLELCRAVLNPQNSSQELSVELCENIYKKYFTGWDSHFHNEDTFIHLHWRDMRIEMSNAEFIEFGKAVSQAYKKLQSYQYKSLSEVFDLLDREKIIYAVIRNWEKLPENVEVGPHSDLDLLIHPHHVELFDDLLDSQLTTTLPYRVQRSVDVLTSDEKKSYILIDVRQPGDGYFSDELAWRMLNRRIRHKNFWVLHPEDHLAGLACHILFHKGFVGKGYPNKLRWLASHVSKWPFSIFQENDITPFLTKIVNESNIDYAQPNDLTVQPVIPLLFEVDNLLTSRFMQFGQQSIFSRVYKIKLNKKKQVIVKQTNAEFARHEFNLLSNLKSEYFPEVWDFEQHNDYSFFREEFVDGVTLFQARALINNWTITEVREFVRQSIELVQTLETLKIQHRDFRADNLIISANGPVLIDFGWATSDQFPMDEPNGSGLGKEARPPDGGPYDPYGLGMVIHLHIQPCFPEFEELSQTLLAGRSYKPVDWTQIQGLLNNIEEKTYSSDVENFITLSEFGRYQNAARLVNAVADSTDEKVAFWLAYLQSLLDEQPFPSNIIVPEKLLENESLLSRLIQVCLSAQDIHYFLPLLSKLMRSYFNICSDCESELFDLIDRHFNQLLPVTGIIKLREFYKKVNRQKIWINLYIPYLLENGTEEEQRDFLQKSGEVKENLTSHSYSAIAQMYFNSGDRDKAEYYANHSLQHDPYMVACARIMAVCAEQRKNVDDAIRWWTHFQILKGKDKEARHHLSELKYQKYLNKNEKNTSAATAIRTENPGEITQNIKQLLNLNETEMALCYLEKLKQVLPANKHSETIIKQIEAIIAKRQNSSSSLHIVIPPLTEDTYAENHAVVKRQLEKLIKTEQGRHPIIISRYNDIMAIDGDADKAKPAVENPSQQVIPLTSIETKANVTATSSESEKVHSLFQKGSHLIKAGKLIDGLEVISQGLELNPQHFDTLQMLGDLYQQLGKEAEAKQMWELALAQEPNNFELIKKINKVTTSATAGEMDSLLAELTNLVDSNKPGS